MRHVLGVDSAHRTAIRVCARATTTCAPAAEGRPDRRTRHPAWGSTEPPRPSKVAVLVQSRSQRRRDSARRPRRRRPRPGGEGGGRGGVGRGGGGQGGGRRGAHGERAAGAVALRSGDHRVVRSFRWQLSGGHQRLGRRSRERRPARPDRREGSRRRRGGGRRHDAGGRNERGGHPDGRDWPRRRALDWAVRAQPVLRARLPSPRARRQVLAERDQVPPAADGSGDRSGARAEARARAEAARRGAHPGGAGAGAGVGADADARLRSGRTQGKRRRRGCRSG